MDSGKLHAGHRERMRKRFLSTGITGFSDHELLELMLFYVLPRVNTNQISHSLIKHFDNFDSVLQANADELSDINGIGSSAALFLNFMSYMSRRYLISSHSNMHFSSSDDIKNYFIDYFNNSDSELCVILNLNMQLELVSAVSFPVESILSGKITPRNIAEIILKYNSYCIVIGINHPDKLPVPTENDYRLTKIIAEILTPLGTEIFDSVICGSGKAFSMRKNGAFSFGQKEIL